jgi:hypothetical protein
MFKNMKRSVQRKKVEKDSLIAATLKLETKVKLLRIRNIGSS